jgi:hypothetical protein
MGAPGVRDAFAALEQEPWLSPLVVGGIIRSAVGAEWKDSTTLANGKYARSWAKACGVETRLRPPTTGGRRMAASMAGARGNNPQQTTMPLLGNAPEAASNGGTQHEATEASS